MKNFLAAFLFLWAFSSAMFAAEITVSSFSLPNWKYQGSTGKLRIYAEKQFVTSDGKVIVPSTQIREEGFYKQVSCTLAAPNLNCPTFVIDSTTDSSNPNAKYTFVFWDADGVKRDVIGSLRIPASPSPTTLAALILYNQSAIAANPATTYSKAEIDALLGNLSLAPNASDAITGKSKLDVAPDNSSNPIAVGVNSPRVSKVLEADFANNLAVAVSLLGSSNVDLIVKSNVPVPADLTIPVNIRLVFENNAQLQPATDVILTVNAMDDPGNREVFGGDGTVRLMPRAAPEFNLAWWAGTDTAQNITAAIDAALANLATNGGGVLRVPQGAWLTNGNHTIPTFTQVYGAGYDGQAAQGTSFVLASGQTPEAMFTIRPVFYSIKIKGITFDTGSSTVTTGVMLKNTQLTNEGITSIGLELDNVAFKGATGAPAQFWIKDASAIEGWGWELLQLNFYHVAFSVPINGIGFRDGTTNSNIVFYQPLVYMSGNATGMRFDYSANIQIINPTFNGYGNYPRPSTLDRTITQASIGSGTKTITISTGTLTANDIGQRVDIAGKVDSYITDVTSPTTAEIFHPATATATNEALNVYRFQPTPSHGYAAMHFLGTHANVQVIGSQDEGLSYFMINDQSQKAGVFSFVNCVIQGQILLNQTATISSVGNSYAGQTYTDSINSASRILSHGDFWNASTNKFYFDTLGNRVNVTPLRSLHFGVKNGATNFVTDMSSLTEDNALKINDRLDFLHRFDTHSSNPMPNEPMVAIGSYLSGKNALRIGQIDELRNEFTNYYDIRRSGVNGYLTFTGNQAGATGFEFNDNVFTPKSFVATRGFIRSGSTALTSAPGMTIDAALGDVFTLTPDQNATIQIINATPGQEIFLEILTSGTTDYGLTFTTNFRPNGVLQTGTVSGKYFIVKFKCTSGGTVCVETSRTPAL